MKTIAGICLVALLALAGCGDTEAKATKSEENGYRNPSKTPPAEASNMAPQIKDGKGPEGAPTGGK